MTTGRNTALSRRVSAKRKKAQTLDFTWRQAELGMAECIPSGMAQSSLTSGFPDNVAYCPLF
jgi:hypothetical protein